MRIAILTLPLHTNYGGILQAFALQTVLEKMGHTVSVLMPEQRKQSIPWRTFLKRLILRCIGRPCGIPVFYELHRTRLREDIDAFVNKRINIRYISSLDIVCPNEYDAIVVGSDQIWRMKYFTRMWNTERLNAFLSFTDNWSIKRIAYAASFGVAEWQFNEVETEQIHRNLSGFDAVSVREASAVSLLQNHTGIDATHVLDPTMLLSAEEYLVLAGKNARKKGGLVSYILDSNDELDAFINDIAKAKGLIRTELKRQINEPCMPIEDWIAGISSAELVVTDSFHGCIFSLIFRKPLIFTGNESRGNARFSTLVETFGLHANMVTDFTQFSPEMSYELPSDIDERIIRMQTISFDYLINSLQK